MDQPIVSCVHAVYAVAWPSWCRDEEGEDRSRREDVAWMRQTGGGAAGAELGLEMGIGHTDGAQSIICLIVIGA